MKTNCMFIRRCKIISSAGISPIKIFFLGWNKESMQIYILAKNKKKERLVEKSVHKRSNL